jgi:acyl-CoA thioester hydrolase
MVETQDLNTASAAGFVHRVRVRYGDCDMQGVVFNPNYFAYVDDAMVMWLQTVLGDDFLERFDYVTKKASMEWFAPARFQDVIELRPAITRWGRTSFDATVRIELDSRLLAQADFVLVSVAPGTLDPAAVPDEVREALGRP